MGETSATLENPPAQSPSFTTTKLTKPEEVSKYMTQLCQILQDCVNQGASIGFLAPLSTEEATTYWTQVSNLITTPTQHLFILTSSSSTPSNPPNPTILATVQLTVSPKITHVHKAEVVKLLVAPSARRQGIARKLMEHVEDFARDEGKEFLVLDTATESPAREMYRRLGWEEWGTCKDYASWPDGSRCDATFFRKELGTIRTQEEE
ncbi:related to acetyltransferase [Phialocephala subalpina]|uniref:Related to acetyltransferase n=1 Tax=Phialocephala subalpina TaxID=576137 RepID=A0A1L7XMN1_9HELO|nr:related to acetyltransferase [Phialocephala subalpina]